MSIDRNRNKTEIECLLEEYTRISFEIRKIKQSLYDIKNNYLTKITNESDKSTKKKLFDQYIIDLDKFGCDSNISQYKQLKYKRKQLLKHFNKINKKSKSKLLDSDTIKQQNSYTANNTNNDINNDITTKGNKHDEINESGEGNDDLSGILNLLLSKYENDNIVKHTIIKQHYGVPREKTCSLVTTKVNEIAGNMSKNEKHRIKKIKINID